MLLLGAPVNGIPEGHAVGARVNSGEPPASTPEASGMAVAAVIGKPTSETARSRIAPSGEVEATLLSRVHSDGLADPIPLIPAWLS